MKNVYLIMIGFSLIFSSCGKYEDGPGFSLASKTSRLTGEWELKELKQNGVISDFNTSSSVDYEAQCYDSWSGYYYLTYTLNSSSSSELEWEFEQDGDFKARNTYSYSYQYYDYVDCNTNTVYYTTSSDSGVDTDSGEWEWEDNKENIEIEIDGQKTEMEILRLTNHELHLEYSEDGYTYELELEKK